MDKHKLIQIVQKDLDELKSLAEEVAAFEHDATLIIDLALSKARLLCQEIEILREYAAPPAVAPENNIEDSDDQDENEDLPVIDPELEIINFEQPDSFEDYEKEVELTEYPEEEEELEDEFVQEEETEVEDEEEPELVPQEEDEEVSEYEKAIEPEQEIEEQINEDEDQPEDDSVNYSEEDIKLEVTGEEPEEDIAYNSDEDEEDELTEEDSDFEDDLVEDDEEENVEEEEGSEVQLNDLSHDTHAGVREIYIDDLDDDDLNNFRIAPANETSGRPVMREIPKPEGPLQEEPVKEKQIIGEKFTKERSLNDAIGESKSTESKLANGPISSLKSAIGINDRFLFIREIFSNNNEKYNTVIDQLDKLETIQEAVDYLKVNLTLQKNDTSLKFVDLLKRRFSK
ncbi:MAG: hypothetical protein WAO52_01665 [Prolixibacteraceae bacterium]